MPSLPPTGAVIRGGCYSLKSRGPKILEKARDFIPQTANFAGLAQVRNVVGPMMGDMFIFQKMRTFLRETPEADTEFAATWTPPHGLTSRSRWWRATGSRSARSTLPSRTSRRREARRAARITGTRGACSAPPGRPRRARAAPARRSTSAATCALLALRLVERSGARSGEFWLQIVFGSLPWFSVLLAFCQNQRAKSVCKARKAEYL